MNPSNTRKLHGLKPLSLLIAATIATPVLAQNEGGIALLEEIVVTARKRAETVQDIPLALSAIDGQALERQGINGLADLPAHVPSLSLYAARGTSSTATAYIRGIGQSDPLWGVEPGVGIYLDDVYLARPQAALLDMLDVERVEVLRGPQGTLYGRNTIGGAIKYITKKPGDELTGQIDLAAGSYGQRDLRAAASGPITDTLRAGIALGSFNRDGFGDNLETGAEVSDKNLDTVRGNLTWLASDAVTVTLAADATRDRSNVRGAQRMLVNPLEIYFAGQPPLPVSDDRYDVNNGFDNQANNTDSRGLSLTVSYAADGAWSGRSVTAWRKGDTDGAIDFDMGPYPIADVSGVYFDRQLSQEFQLNYDADNLQAVLGLYLLKAEAGGEVRNLFGIPLSLLTPLVPPTLIPGPIHTREGLSTGQVDTRSLALYGDLSWQFAPDWTLSTGLRVGTERKEADVLNQQVDSNIFTPPTSLVTSDFTKDKSWTDVSPRLSLDYQVAENVLTYASVAKGFKSGGFNIRANTLLVPGSDEAYKPESVLTYEVGVKSTLAEQLQLNLALFDSDYRDIQLSIFTGNGQGGFIGDFTNAGRGTIRGAELEYVWTPVDNFTLSGNAAYLDASYQEFINRGVDIAGQAEFPDVPELAYAINAEWRWALSGQVQLSTAINYSWRDEVQPVTNQSDLLRQDAFGLWNAKLLLTPVDGHWSLALEGKNLTDEEYRTTGYDLRDSGFPIVSGYYGDPRTVTLRLGYRF